MTTRSFRDVHHVRHLLLTCAAALGLGVLAGCPAGGGGGAAPKPAPAPNNGKTAAPAAGDGAETPAISTDPAPGYPESATNPAPLALKKNWFVTDVSAWVGKNWRDVDLFQHMPTWPAGLDEAKRYVVFYSRTCDHCEEMFEMDLAPHADRARMTTAIEIPESRDVMTSPDAWAMPETACTLAALPLGMNYIITSPLVLRLENGVVACATEGEHAECMEIE